MSSRNRKLFLNKLFFSDGKRKIGTIFVIDTTNQNTDVMKKSILSLLMLLVAGMTSTLMAQEVRQGAIIEFEKDVHDYGEVPHMGNGTYSFIFKNTGTEPLVISNAKGSCGCTVPSWPKEPIAPGKSAKIDVTYDTKRVGPISKSVTITSNAENTPVKVLRIQGTVLSEAAPEPVAEEVAPVVDVVEEVVEEVAPMTKDQLKAEKKRLKKEAKARKKAEKASKKLAKKEDKMMKKRQKEEKS